MLTVSQMRTSIDALVTEIDHIRSNANCENRELNKDEEDIIARSLSRVRELEASIALELDLEATKTRLSQPTNTPIKPDLKNTYPAGSVRVEDRKGDRFYSIGEQIMAIRRAFQNQGVDPRLNVENNPAFRSISGMGIQVPTDGGLA